MNGDAGPHSRGAEASEASTDGDVDEPVTGRWKSRLVGGGRAGTSTLWISVVLVLLLALFTVLAPREFVSAANIRNILTNASSLLLLAVGETYVIITAGIDLSVGSVLIFSGVVSAKVMLWTGDQRSGPGVALLGLLAALVCGLAWGALNGFLIVHTRVTSLIVTLGTLSMALGMSQILTNGVDLSGVPDILNRTVGSGEFLGIPWLVWITLVVTAFLGVVLAVTRFGRRTYAIGSNEEAARRAGIPVGAHLVKIYAMSGLLAGLAGFLNLARFTTTTLGGHAADNLNAIAGVVIGGTSLFGGVGVIFGTVIGVLIPAVLQTGLVIIGVQPYWEEVLIGAVLIGAVYIDQLRRQRRSG